MNVFSSWPKLHLHHTGDRKEVLKVRYGHRRCRYDHWGLQDMDMWRIKTPFIIFENLILKCQLSTYLIRSVRYHTPEGPLWTEKGLADRD